MNALEQLASRNTADPNGPVGTVHYIYDLDGHLIAEADAATGATTQEYLWLPSNDNQNDTLSESTLPQLAGGGARKAEGVPDLPLAVIANVNTTPVTYMVHTDHLGRPTRMTDAAKATVWQASWKPWGEVQSISGTILNNLRFPGQYFQIETGLAYNWHRTYDPVTGRYTQPDPLRFVDGPSVYAYAGNSPFMETDPTGELGIAGAFVGGGADLAWQLFNNGGRIGCIDWGQVGLSAVMGSFGGNLMQIGRWGSKTKWFWQVKWDKFNTVSKRLRGRNGLVGSRNDLHHWGFRQNARVPGWLKNNPINLRLVPDTIHKEIHKTSSSFFYRWWHGTPTWTKLLPTALAPDCSCDD
jgi:RHS repeat-associated protein